MLLHLVLYLRSLDLEVSGLKLTQRTDRPKQADKLRIQRTNAVRLLRDAYQQLLDGWSQRKDHGCIARIHIEIQPAIELHHGIPVAGGDPINAFAPKQ
uniref:Putative secreted protein n=1 Tax=Anopheles marajoara TaxID=58244 RepID=A0A2M4CA27_9DIPT